MTYGIKPLRHVEAAYVWRFDNLGDAKDEAIKLATTHDVEVIVFSVVGTYRRPTVWEWEKDA